MSTLLSNIGDVCLELGITVPGAVVSATDETTKQVFSLMNRVGKMLATEHDFQALAKTHFIQTVSYQYTGDLTAGSATISNLSSVVGLSTDFVAQGVGVPTNNIILSVGASSVALSSPATESGTGVPIAFDQVNYSMPSDYDRMVPDSVFQGSWATQGPLTPQEWNALKTGVSAGAFLGFRIMGDKFCVWPPPSYIMEISYEYISKNWAVSSAGVGKEKFTADNDTSIFPDMLLILGTKLKFFEIKGFDTTTLLNDFVREVSKFKGADAGSRTLNMAGRKNTIPFPSVPDTGYGA